MHFSNIFELFSKFALLLNTIPNEQVNNKLLQNISQDTNSHIFLSENVNFTQNPLLYDEEISKYNFTLNSNLKHNHNSIKKFTLKKINQILNNIETIECSLQEECTKNRDELFEKLYNNLEILVMESVKPCKRAAVSDKYEISNLDVAPPDSEANAEITKNSK